MSKKILLNEVYFIKPSIEESKENGFLKFKGVFQRADVVNENIRIYPRNVLEKAINEFKKKVEKGRAVGTLEHPEDGKTRAYEISHRITNIYINENGEVIGEGIVLDTTKGKELKALLLGGVSIGISSRGFGSVKEIYKDGQKVYEVQDDFEIDTFDVVYDPSTPNVFVSMNESKKEQEKVYTKEDFEKFAKEILEKTSRIIKKIEEELDEFYKEKYKKLIEENIDAKEKLILNAIVKLVEPLSETIAKEMKEANEKLIEELKNEINEAKEEIRRLEFENYKLQKIAESHNPDEIKRLLEEAKTKYEVDEIIKKHKKEKSLTEHKTKTQTVERPNIFGKFINKPTIKI